MKSTMKLSDGGLESVQRWRNEFAVSRCSSGERLGWSESPRTSEHTRASGRARSLHFFGVAAHGRGPQARVLAAHQPPVRLFAPRRGGMASGARGRKRCSGTRRLTRSAETSGETRGWCCTGGQPCALGAWEAAEQHTAQGQSRRGRPK
jgi:hypothetical protein